MKTYAVRIKRLAYVTYHGEVEAPSPKEAAKIAQTGFELGILNGFERDSASLEEFNEIADIRPDYDVEEIE